MGRRQVTVRLSDERIDALDAEAEERGTDRAALIREALDSRSELADCQSEVDRLRSELRATNARQEDVGELVEYVERERTLQERREERRDAPAWRRAKWWLFGRGEGEA